MELNPIAESYSLAPMQQGMLFHSLYAPRSGVDIEQMMISWHESVQVLAFGQAWQHVIERHPVLRTSFRWAGLDEPRQEVHRYISLELTQQDWRALPVQEQKSQLAAFLHSDRQRSFELTEAPLMRLALFRLGQADYQCVWTFHHILLDGRALPVILQELFSFYEAICQGRDLQLSSPRPYRTYIEWLQRQDFTRTEGFWRQLLQGFTAPTPLIVDQIFEGKSGRAREQGEQVIRLSARITSTLQALARHHHLTVNTLVQGAWAVLLSRYSREQEVLFGATRACRQAPVEGAGSMVGLLINTVPIRVKVPPEVPLLPWLRELRAQSLALREAGREHTPLAKIQEWSDVPRGLPLFESLLVFENYDLNSTLQAGGGNWKNREFRLLEQTNYPLALNGYLGSQLLLKIAYDKGRFGDGTISRMLGHLQTVLESMAADPAQRLADLPLFTNEERQQWFGMHDEKSVAYPPHYCLHQLFEIQVEQTPDAVALVGMDERLTYQELNRRANQLAHYLQTLGVGPEVLVGLCLDRSLEMIVAILGVLKAGGAYVPLDLAYPIDRLAFVLADSGVPVLITESSLLANLPEHQAQIVCLDTVLEFTAQESVENPGSGVTANNLAYVIYTSGSTGSPKGTLISHYNVVHLFETTHALFRFDESDVWTLFHSYAFDFSVWELWGALLYGGRLVIVPYWVSRSPEAFYDLLGTEQVTVLNQTPSAFWQLTRLEETVGSRQDLALRLIIFGGEVLEPQRLKPWFDRHGDQAPQLVNMYGITETTVHVTYRPLTKADLRQGLGSVIGDPLPDLQLYLLDQSLQPVPIGVPGELYVGGAGLARGYLKRPDLTSERFIPDPFSNKPEARLYKSGDLARYLPNGDLEYLGRLDQQVKIRGFRLELGEIERVLEQHPAVRESVVMLREDTPNDKRLVAYLMTVRQQAPTFTELHSFLKRKLPDYMLPSAFVMLDTLPLTLNGKVDRRALPAPDQRLEADEAFVAPRTSIEEALAGIWANILGVTRIGINDNFFELGGHSLLATQVMSRIHDTFQIELPLRSLFEAPTIAELATVIVQKEVSQVDSETLAALLAELASNHRLFTGPDNCLLFWREEP